MLKASFVMPVRNGEKFIQKTIDSVLNQTYKNLELVIVNDHSEDATLDLLHTIAKKRQNIKVLDLNKDSGISAGRNLGTKSASGEIILPIDADDPSFPKRAELSIKMLEENNADVCYGNVERFYTDTELRELRHFQPYDEKMLRNINYIAHGASAFKRDVFDRAQAYDSNFKIGEDYDFFLTAQENGFKFCSENIPVSQYSMHSGQITSSLDPGKIAERQKWNRLIREKHKIWSVDPEYVKTHATPEIIDFYINKNFDIWFSEESVPKEN